MKFSHWNDEGLACYIRQAELIKVDIQCTYKGGSVSKFVVESTQPLNEYELKYVTDEGPFGFYVKEIGTHKYEITAYTQ